jgi:hypothetical protein
MVKLHRFAKGTSAHVTADRSDGPGRRPRKQKFIADGGTTPHLGTCEACKGEVIFHRRAAGGATVVLDRDPLVHTDKWARFVIFAGTALEDPDPRNVPDGMAYHREHVCPTVATEAI